MNVAIVGSRGFATVEAIERSLRKLHSQHPDLTVVSGGASGADSIAEEVANRLGIPTRIFPAQWALYGKAAGFLRNKDIVDNADVLLAFYAPGPLSRGTSHSVGLARAKGIPVHIYHEGGWSS